MGFSEAMLAGLAPDGGLYVPVELPPPTDAWRAARTPAEVAGAVLGPLLGSPRSVVESTFAAALDFPLPVVDVGGTHVLELFSGPTGAFKDVGARVMARLMEAELSRRGEEATVVVATSGDTGGAVADAFSGSRSLAVAVLFPRGQVSGVQEDQLTAVRPGVTAFSVAGSFDDCQRMVKAVLARQGAAGRRLSTANSINVARLLPQTVYYLWAAAELERAGDRRAPTFVVPSGNLGDLTAGMLAAELGGLRASFVAAHNVNDYFPRYLRGQADAYSFRPSVRTLSNAMDVGGPSNFERLHDRFGDRLRDLVRAQVVDDDATLERMAITFSESGYLACPHTAVGLEAAARELAQGREGPFVCLATAHPAKFPEAVQRATGVTPPPHPGLSALASAEHASVAIPPDEEALWTELSSRGLA